MKRKGYTRLSALISILILLLCMPLVAYSGDAMGNNPGQVPPGYKTIGPHAKGVLLVGWKYDWQEENNGKNLVYGTVAAFLVVDGHSYFRFLKSDSELETFKTTAATEIITWDFPIELADLYNLSDATLVRVLSEKDVTTEVKINNNTYEFTPPDDPIKVDEDNPYHYMLSCEVKLTFLTGEPIP